MFYVYEPLISFAMASTTCCDKGVRELGQNENEGELEKISKQEN